MPSQPTAKETTCVCGHSREEKSPMPLHYIDFQKWFYSRGDFYKKLKMQFYISGEPYFYSQGTECSLTDYYRRAELVKDVYTMEYVSGGGTRYNGGLWRLKSTKKMYVFTLLDEPFYEPNWKKLVLMKDVLKNRKHSYEYHEDGTWTIYPDQCGIPHVFEGIEPEKIEETIAYLNTLHPSIHEGLIWQKYMQKI